MNIVIENFGLIYILMPCTIYIEEVLQSHLQRLEQEVEEYEFNRTMLLSTKDLSMKTNCLLGILRNGLNTLKNTRDIKALRNQKKQQRLLL